MTAFQTGYFMCFMIGILCLLGGFALLELKLPVPGIFCFGIAFIWFIGVLLARRREAQKNNEEESR